MAEKSAVLEESGVVSLLGLAVSRDRVSLSAALLSRNPLERLVAAVNLSTPLDSIRAVENDSDRCIGTAAKNTIEMFSVRALSKRLEALKFRFPESSIEFELITTSEESLIRRKVKEGHAGERFRIALNLNTPYDCLCQLCSEDEKVPNVKRAARSTKSLFEIGALKQRLLSVRGLASVDYKDELEELLDGLKEVEEAKDRLRR